MFNLKPPNILGATLAANANTTIEYEVEVGTSVNAEGFTLIDTTTAQLRAIAHYDQKISPNDIFPNGMDLKGEMMRGRLTTPKLFPAELPDLSQVTVTMDDGRSGTALLHYKTQNPYQTAEVLGAEFYLLFREG